MTYTPNTPTLQMPYAIWQETFQNNFQVAYNAFAKDHVALDAASYAGNHNTLTMPAQVGNMPAAATEISMYGRIVPEQSNLPQIQAFMKYGNGTEFQYTAYQIWGLGPSNNQTYNFTFLPGGLCVFFGTVLLNSTPFNLLINPPIAKNILSANFTNISNLNLVNPILSVEPVESGGYINSLTLTDFLGLPAPVNMYYMVVANI